MKIGIVINHIIYYYLDMNDNDFVILLVEDEKALRSAIKNTLEKKGFYVITAVNVDQALHHLDDKDINVDTMWLDHYLLGEKSGLDFMAIIKDKGYLESLLIYVVTNTAGYEKQETYIQLGAEKYFVKSDNKLDDIVDDMYTALLEIKKK